MVSICDFGKFSLYNERQLCYNFRARTYTFWAIFERAWYSKMMRVMKRNIVIILLLSMIVSMFPAQVIATVAETGGEIPAPMASSGDAEVGEMSETWSKSMSHERETAMPEESFPDIVTPAKTMNNQNLEAVLDESADSISLLADTLTYGYLQYAVNGDSITITDFNQSVTSAVIPSQINGVSVTSIGGCAFSYCDSLTSITIPESVTSIGDSAFYGCSSLTSIAIPDSVTSIGDSAFYGCSSLTSIAIPNSVTSIGGGAFSSCRSLTSITIPNGVTSIEVWTFYDCYSLTNITLPDSVTSIGEYAFYDCDSLTSVTIPNSVTSIGDYAFCGCGGLTGTIPAGITYIGDYTFYGCGGLTGTIPAGITYIGNYTFYGCGGLTGTIPACVTYIGDWAFFDCGGLTSVTIPQGVTSIGDYAFCRCGGLTSMTIPQGVTSIGAYAFCGCDSLISIAIPQGVTSIREGLFSGCNSLKNVKIPEGVICISCDYYIEDNEIQFCSHSDRYYDLSDSLGAFSACTSLSSVTIPRSVMRIGPATFAACSSLTSLTIPERVTHIDAGAFSDCTSLTNLTIPEGVTRINQFTFLRCSSLTKISIPNSVLCIEDQAFEYCDSLTDIYYTGTTEQWKKISGIATYASPLYGSDCYYELRSKYEYYDKLYGQYYQSVIRFPSNSIHFNSGDDTFEDGDENNSPISAPFIQSANIIRENRIFNLLTVVQIFEKNCSETVSIEIIVDWRTTPVGKIQLLQSADKYLESNDGHFENIQPGIFFQADKEILVNVIDKNGGILESRPVYLRVTEKDEAPSDFQFKLFDKITFTVAEDKPVFGNQDFDIDIGAAHGEIEFDTTKGKFKVAIGANFEKNSDGKFGLSEYQSFRETINRAKEDIKTGKSAAMIMDSLSRRGSRFTNMTIKSGWKPSASVCGYIEGRIDNGQLVPVSGGVIFAAEMKYSYQGQVIVVTVPICYSIGGGGSVGATLGIKGMGTAEEVRPEFAGNLEISPYGEISGGVGVVYLGQVGARGKATLNINVALDHDYRKVDLTGKAYFEIKALTMKLFEREFAYGTWTVYETGDNSTVNLQSAPENIYAAIDMDSPVKPEDRSYANLPTRWLGEESTASVQTADDGNKELRVLQINSYPDAKPQIMDVEGTKVIVWVSDNTSRSAINKSMLVYSVYDSASDTWSNPKAVMDNGMGDYYPVAKDGYVVWQKASEEFDASTTVADVSKSMELYIAKFNGTAFDTPTRLTNNDIMDAQPQIATDGNSVTLVWTQNTENNILGYTGKNAIYQLTYDGSSWSDATPLVSDLNTIAHLTVGYMGNIPVVAYVLDGDNDLNTIADREIYLVRNGSVERFTNNDVIDSNPVFETINGVPALFWYSGDNICYVTDLDTQVLNTVSADGIYQLTDDYSIMSNGNSTVILWTAVQDGVSEVYGALYDGSQWSQDVEVTQTGQAARYPDGIIEEDGKLLVSFNRIQNIEDGDYYKDGQADLCVIRVTPSYDLSVSDVFVGDGLASNTEVPIYLTLKNSGELPLTSAYVNILDVDGSQNSRLDYERTLQPGESVDLEAVYKTGDSVTAGNIRVQAGTSDGTEYNEDNNTVSVAIGLSDMEVTDVTDTPDGDTHHVTVAVKNSGYTAASNVNVTISDNAQNIIAHQTLETVSAQATENVSFDIDANSLATENSFITLTAAVSADTEDSNAGNNSQAFTIDKGSQSPTPSNDGYVINNLSVENNVVRVSVTSNTTENAQLWVASYASNGKFLKATSKDITPETVAENPVELSLSTSGAAYVSAFILDGDGNMKPLCPKKSQNL